MTIVISLLLAISGLILIIWNMSISDMIYGKQTTITSDLSGIELNENWSGLRIVCRVFVLFFAIALLVGAAVNFTGPLTL